MEIKQSKSVKPTMIGRILGSGVIWYGALTL